MSRHITKHGDDYLLSMPATLALVADAIHSPDAGPAGKIRAQRVIDQVMSAARTAKFEQADILETLLGSRTAVARLVPIFDALVARIGAGLVVNIIRNGLGPVPQGDAK